jgi:glycosyltransferase involved in cell wall biosynthesis
MASPKVSVCIPVYNGAEFIRAAMLSVVEQTLKDIEIIVLDNNSEDATFAIASQLKDPRLRVLRHSSNIGAAANFNAGLREARAPWVKILCADDLLHPNCLSRQIEAIERDGTGKTTLVCAARTVIDRNGLFLMSRGFPSKEGYVSGKVAVESAIKLGTNPFGEPSAVLLHRQTALDVGGFDPRWNYCIDIDLWAKILRRGNAFIDQTQLSYFRVWSNSWSNSLVNRQAQEFCNWIDSEVRAESVSSGRIPVALGKLRAYKLAAMRSVLYQVLG